MTTNGEDAAGVPTPDTVLIVGGTDETVRTAVDLGLRVLLLQHPEKVSDVQRELADVRVLDFTDWTAVEPAARELFAAPGFARALSLTEPGVVPAARINDLFSLGGNGFEVVQRMRHKWLMRDHLRGKDPDAVGAALLERRSDLDTFAARYHYPFVVKPVDATASIGVTLVRDPDDLAGVWEQVQKLRGTRTDRVSTLFTLNEFMMEEYVGGPEFSVESFSHGGVHTVVAVTEKFTGDGHFAELGHAVPARVAEADAQRIAAAVLRFLTLMGVRHGVCHTEVKLDGGRARVIEGHNRLGGDAIPDLVRAAYGVDLTRLALGVPFGLVDPVGSDLVALAGACTRFLVTPGRGVVRAVHGVERATARPEVLSATVRVAPGDVVRPLRDNWDRLGVVVVRGMDTTDAVNLSTKVIAEDLHVVIDGEDGDTWQAEATSIRGSLTTVHRSPSRDGRRQEAGLR